MVDGNKDTEELRRKAEVLGVKEDTDSALDKLDALFPEVAKAAEEAEISERRRFETLKKEYDFLYDLEFKRMKLAELNPNAAAEEFDIDPQVGARLGLLKDQMSNIVAGNDAQQLEQLQQENPQLIDLSEDVTITEQDVFDLMANPKDLQAVVSNFNELGQTEAASRLSEIIALNSQNPVLSNQIQVPPTPVETGQVEALPDPKAVGRTGAGPTNVIENITQNIQSFFDRTRPSQGAVSSGAAAGERVRAISADLKRQQNRRQVFPGSFS